MSTESAIPKEPLVRVAALEFLEGRARKGATREAVDLALAREWTGPQVGHALEQLSRMGDAVEWSRRWYAIRFIDFEIGRVWVLERGDALIRTGSSGEAGLFVRRRNLKGATEGDLVLLRRARERKGRSRSQTRLPDATVVRILRRRYTRMVGSVEVREGARWLTPFDSKIKYPIKIEGGEEVEEGVFVIVDLPPSSHSGKGPVKGHITEILGDPETPGVDVVVVLRHYEIPEDFPPEVLDEARSFPTDPDPDDFKDREDLRDKILITIDSESARDFDDAISIDRLASGGFELGVHIADVSAYVRPGSVLDREAYRRGTSVYYPDRAIPMLPEHLSNGLCSLRPNQPRLALSAFLTFDSKGTLEKKRFARSLIASYRRMTYQEVQEIVEGRAADTSIKEDPRILKLVGTAESLMRKLWDKRVERGSIDFDLPEGDVILDSEGFTVGVTPEQRTVANRIIEEFMIAANEAVAEELYGHETPTLFRIHNAPNPKDLEELRWILHELGIDFKGDMEALHPSVLQDLLKRVEGRPEESFVASLVLRSMQRAVYQPESHGHYALSSAHYLHFTSPIRRYPDLLVHRQLKALLDGRPGDREEADLLRRALPAMAEHCSTTERRAEQSERALLQWKLVRFLASRVGETFRGRVTGVQPFGIFVQLMDYFVDGLVPIRTMTDDFYVFEAEKHRLVGRSSGHRVRLADEVEVVLSGVDLQRRGLELRLRNQA